MRSNNVADPCCFDVLFYANPQPMWIFDVNSLQILEVNNAATERYGYTHHEFLKKTIIDLRPEEDIPLLEDILPSVRGHDIQRREFRHVTKNGNVLFAEIISYSITYMGVHARIVFAPSVDEKRELAGKLMLTQKRLLQILETTVIGFLQINYQWNITYWNHAAEELIGYRSQDVLGCNFWEVLSEIRNSDFQLQFQRAMHSHQNVDFIDYFWPTQKWFACNAYPADDGIIVHLRDITAKKKVEESLLKKIDQLKEVSFLNSHAVRKPIASLLGLTNLVKEELINPEEFKEVAELIHHCSMELDEVVREVNNKVSDENDAMPYRALVEDFSFKDLLRTVVSQAQTYSPKHRVIAERLDDVAFYGNKQSIEKAVKYLIINAIRFSPNADKVLLKAETIKHNLVLSVQDFGKGITEECVEEIFKDLSVRKTPVAISTGLLNVSTICHQHHGSIWLESAVGRGTTFMMRFPLSNIAMFKVTGRPDFSVYQDARTDITYNLKHQYLNVEWSGFHNIQTAKEGCSKILSMMTETGCYNILNNNQAVLGSWGDAMNWVAKEWFPMMKAAGMKHFAWVYSPSTFGKLSAAYTVELTEPKAAIKAFDSKKQAVSWLQQLRKQ